MRKAFDANVPKLRPRLKANGAAAGTGTLPLADAPDGGAGGEVASASTPTSTAVESTAVHPEPFSRAPAHPERSGGEAPAESKGPETAARSRRAPTPTATPTATPTVHPERSDAAEAAARSRRAPTATPTPTSASYAPSPRAPLPQSGSGAEGEGEIAPHGAMDVLTRKERLEKIKRKVAEASRPSARPAPTPADPARAAESVLGLVRDLEQELLRARDREDALGADLEEARKELSRTAADGRGAAERLGAAEKELEEKRGVLAELLDEMKALEDERDESVRRAQALAALDEERARLLEEVTRRAEEEAKVRAEREAEVERLSEELRVGAQDGARLRAAVGELARERDQLATELERAMKERDDLAQAKRALEQVHAALAQARARLG